MNRYSNRLIELNLPGISLWLGVLLVVAAAGSLGLNWLLNWIAALLLLLVLGPIVAVLGLIWWAKRKIVEGPCPVCGFGMTGFEGMDCNCLQCGEPLAVSERQFQRRTPPGTVDVTVVEVSPPNAHNQLSPGPGDRGA